MNIQLKKGVLELCVLALLSRRDQYGYELASTLSDRIVIADGTVYPILRKLAADKKVTTYLKESSSGPPRKYYALTPAGSQELASQLAQWQELIVSVDRLLGEKEND